MSKLEVLFEKISNRITPTLEQALHEKMLAAKLVSKLEGELSTAGVKVLFIGSSARDTGLAKETDLDLFVQWPKTYEKDEIVKLTIAAAKHAINVKWEMHYAEHPYLQGNYNGFKVEVIPCFEIDPHSEVKSAVDRSPLHMNYLQARLSEKQKRDVRVLKKFLKANKIYGAELEVHGFSGLTCEQLILNYRNLENLLATASNEWKMPIIIDLEGNWPNKEKLIKKFPDAPLILVDAIDKNRNAAAAISTESLAKFILLARKFLAKPSEAAFFPKKQSFTSQQVSKKVNSRGTALFAIRLAKPTVVDDVLFPQLRKLEHGVMKTLEKNHFKVWGSLSECTNESCLIVIEVENALLPNVEVKTGPPVWLAKDVSNFLKSNKATRGPYVKNERVMLDVNRKVKTASQAFGAFFANAKAHGIPSNFATKAKQAKIIDLRKELIKLTKEELQIPGKYLFEKV